MLFRAETVTLESETTKTFNLHSDRDRSRNGLKGCFLRDFSQDFPPPGVGDLSDIKTPVWKGRMRRSVSDSNLLLTVCRQKVKYQEMVQVPVCAEKQNEVAVNLYDSIMTILIWIAWKSGYSEEPTLSLSGTTRDLIKIYFILLLVCQPQAVTCCGTGKYYYDGQCCWMCAPGTKVLKHCTELFGTTCVPCTGGEYTEHPNGLEKCLKCKACDPELGLQIKLECIYTRNTLCEIKEGYYCLDKSCQMGGKHKTCLPGEGVKEKGTHFKDTVCEHCPDGKYSSSNSSTEECKDWTKCEFNHVQVKSGSSSTDVVCAKSKLPIILGIVSPLIVILIAVTVGLLIYKKRKIKRNKHSDDEETANKSQREDLLKDKTKQNNKPTPETGGYPQEDSANPNRNPLQKQSPLSLGKSDTSFYHHPSVGGM
ncbi:tumor necrosis factor receptor superfamily member 14-like isoform X2 [Heterodontus francisci]|uniref:tumor necrosis factor receptor superfamily member 14-like isoform X2 n=1 Tax=Heterodontus francisci TaxID=7792 RepID=UPI00355BB3DA